MVNLELKVPPILLLLIFTLIMWLTSLISKDFYAPALIQYGISTIVLLAGALFIISGVTSFKNAKTTINPLRPDSSTSLVTIGVYRITRNPMYFGCFLILASWAIFLSNIFSLFFSIGFILYMNRFQIIPEEKVMTELFGDEYLTYKNKVNRWL